MPISIPWEPSPPVSLPPRWVTAKPHLPRRPSKTHRQVWPRLLWSHCFALGPSAYETLCAPSKSGVCFPQSCGAPALKPCWPSKPNALGLLLPDPQLGSLMWGSELSLQWDNLWDRVIFSLWVTHPAGMGFDYIVKVPLLPSHCGSFFIFGCRISFMVGSRVFLSIVVQQLVSCDFGAFMRGEKVISSPATPPSCLQSLLQMF